MSQGVRAFQHYTLARALCEKSLHSMPGFATLRGLGPADFINCSYTRKSTDVQNLPGHRQGPDERQQRVACQEPPQAPFSA